MAPVACWRTGVTPAVLASEVVLQGKAPPTAAAIGRVAAAIVAAVAHTFTAGKPSEPCPPQRNAAAFYECS